MTKEPDSAALLHARDLIQRRGATEARTWALSVLDTVLRGHCPRCDGTGRQTYPELVVGACQICGGDGKLSVLLLPPYQVEMAHHVLALCAEQE